MNTPFSQFIEATTVVRKVIKYVFITWALVLGIVTLAYLPSLKIFHSSDEVVQNESTLVQKAATPGTDISTNNSMAPTLSVQLKNTDPQGENIAKSLINTPENKTKPLALAAARDDDTKSVTPLSGKTIYVAAYKATLFSAVDTDQPTQTPLQNGAELVLIETKGEWMKVKVSETGGIGFIHSSQVE